MSVRRAARVGWHFVVVILILFCLAYVAKSMNHETMNRDRGGFDFSDSKKFNLENKMVIVRMECKIHAGEDCVDDFQCC
ncbi:hypothetical protein AVEN_197878-1 [Araneus ventricosus]|uniref:Uncharacterized protein n=1 Tax=Araneus ventricosus TaxID=182803 RepID=A0A4Y2X8M1_ARAVE|nr:hypothetical protein AVEN_197878-1 [Araneus ventricosus]